MNITYNGLNNPTNLITFSDIPNILKVEDESGGTNAWIRLVFNSSMQSATDSEDQWSITIDGQTVTNTLSPANAVNKHFYVGSDSTSTAASVASALRNCSSVSSEYNIYHSASTVYITAKSIGEKWGGSFLNNYYKSNIPTMYMANYYQDGSAFSDLYGSDIILNVYSDGDYVTTMQKKWWNGECAFNMTPLLCTLSTPLKVKEYDMVLGSLKDGEYSDLGTVSDNYATVGYMCNQGMKYLDNEYMNLAMNTRKGNEDFELYVYQPMIPISFYNGDTGGMYIIVEYQNSAHEQIGSASTEWRNSDSSKKLWHIDLPMDVRWYYQSYYVVVHLGTIDVTYNVIRPFTMAEDCTRIYWVNSYGGRSFADFTGKRTETRNLETTTYQKNIFDFYTADMEELDKVYSNTVRTDITLRTHLISKKGTYIFDDLMQTPKAWTYINNVAYGVIIDSVSVDELDNNNDIFEATVRYRLSQPTTLI